MGPLRQRRPTDGHPAWTVLGLLIGVLLFWLVAGCYPPWC